MDVALTDGVVEIVGALDLDRTDTGISPRRLPAWTRPQIPDLFMDGRVFDPAKASDYAANFAIKRLPG